MTKLAYTYIAKRRYWRFRRAGIDAALPGQPGEPEFHIKYAELLTLSKSKPPEHDRASFRWLVERFEGSAEFKHLAASTQLDYSKTLRIIEDELGDEPFAITTRGMIKLVRDGMASTPRKAHKFIQTVSVLYGYAASEDLVPDGFNPAAKIRKLKAKVKPYIAWSEPEIALFLSKSPAHVITPVMLALYTGQRREDVVSMDWEDCKSTTPRRFSSNVRSRSPFVPVRDSAGLRGALRTFLAPPASEPKADLALGIVTIFLRTHRVVHRRITMGYGGSADGGAA